MFVAGVNRVGKDKGLAPEKARNHFGSSMIVNHRGEIMSQGSAESDEIIYADLDLAPMYEFRNHCGYYRDRRPNVYSRLSVDG
jgi:beta-ureidopropionase